MAEKKKKWIQGAVKRPGRLTKAAAAAGVSKLQLAEKWSHSSDPSKRGAGLLGKRFIKGKLHSGGIVNADGLYEMQKGERVIPAKEAEVSQKQAMGDPSRQDILRSNAHPHQTDAEAMPNTPGSHEGPGHWEIDCHDVKFVKE